MNFSPIPRRPDSFPAPSARWAPNRAISQCADSFRMPAAPAAPAGEGAPHAL